MLKGFNLWQKYIAIAGILGLAFAALGLVGPWLFAIVSGICVGLASLLVLVLLGNRQNWRQLKAVQNATSRLEARTPRTLHSERKSPADIHVGSAYEYARRIAITPSPYESFALRSKSLLIRDAFALAATSNQFRFHELVQLIATQRMSMLPDFKQTHTRKWNKAPLLALARLQANQRATEYDLENAVRFFKFIQTFFGSKSLRRNDRLIFLEALGELGEFPQQSSLAKSFKTAQYFPVQAKLLELNALQHTINPRSQEWISTLNQLFQQYDCAPATLSHDENAPLLDRLMTQSSPVSGGPKVTIIVPTYQGGGSLIYALRSLLNQSWQNIEIIVVDDGSGPEYNAYLEQATSLSPKIQVIKQKENLGAYCARNAGLAAATGDFITIHDDDDWSHSDKIATQVQHLLNNPHAPGNMSAHVRVTEDLKFVRINNNPVLTQANFSSLMVHKSIFERIGAWDTVNRGGDSEFRDRIVQFFGQPVETLMDVPLSFTRTWEGSLTSGEMSRGFIDPSRLLYLAAYTQHHNSVAGDLSRLHPATPRKFPIPSSMRAGHRRKSLGEFDVVFMTDFRFPGGTSSLTLKEIEEAAKAGLRVGYIQADSPLNASNTPVKNELFALQLEGLVEQVGLDDFADINLLLVRHPSVVTYMDNVSSNLRIARTVLIVNNPPVLTGGSGMVFDLASAVHNVDTLFHSKTKVIAESQLTRRLCEAYVPAARLLDSTWPGVIALSDPTEPDFSKKPTVGRHSRDHSLKWPSSKTEFRSAYCSPNFNTHILGGVDELKSKLGADIIEGLRTYEFGELDVQEFLTDVDFWVYFHDKKLTESFGMSIAEAMANGKVVILPRYLETSFGNGALYADPEEVSAIVHEYWSNPESYLEQSKRAREFVSQNFSPNAFLERINIFSQII